MRKVNVIAIAFCLVFAGSALAACPDVLDQIWSSVPDSDPSYQPILNGRISEAWCNGNAGETGNLQNALSWDGNSAELGMEWQFFNMAIDAAGPVVVFDGVSGGNGIQIIQTAYDGGEFWLAGDGSWTNDNTPLTGSVLDYLVVTTVTYSGGEIVAAVSNITFNGTFDDCPDANGCVIEFAILNAALVWRTGDDFAMPAGYPAFLCGQGDGELHATSDFTMGIHCVVATESVSWTDIKSQY
jgi:hypothetical protein